MAHPMLHLHFAGDVEARLPVEYRLVQIPDATPGAKNVLATVVIFPYTRGRVKFLFTKFQEQRVHNSMLVAYLSNAQDVLLCGPDFLSGLREERFDEHLGLPNC